MSTRQVLGVVGAFVGAYFGNPQLGYAIGSAIGGAVDPEVIKGPGIGDIIDQTSMEGGPRPFFYAVSKPVAGNIIAQGAPRKVVRRESQGKGGPKVQTESVYRTYAVGVGEGEVDLIQAWRNGQLVYDISAGSQLSTEDNQNFLATARWFTGSFTQDPSPDLETILGVGTTPAHRGTAYMVQADEDLTDLRGAIPQWTFRVQRCGAAQPALLAFSATGPDGTHQVMRSIDGATFTAIETPLNVDSPLNGFPWADAVYSRALGRVLAVSEGNAGDMMISDDGGETWTLVDHGLVDADNFNWRAVTWSEPLGLFAAIRPHATRAVATSPDGETWTLRDTPNFSNAQAIFALDSGRIVAGQAGVVGVDRIMTSDDGITWTLRTAASFNVHDLAAKGSRVWGTSRGDLFMWESVDDGTTWNLIGTGLPFGITDVVFSSESTDALAVSIFGVGLSSGFAPFDPFASPSTEQWEGVCYSAAFDGFYLSSAPGSGEDYRIGVINGDTPTSTVDLIAVTPDLVGGEWNTIIAIDSAAAGTCDWSLADIVRDICDRAGLPATLVDASDLEDLVCHGLTVTNQYPALGALRALSEVFLFDPADIDGKVHFVRRGHDSVATITEEDLLDDEQDIEQSERKDAISIPRVVHLNYHDVAGGIATDKQTSERAGDRRASGEVSTQSPVLMSAPEAAKVVAINHKVMAENQRGELKFQLADNFIALVPTDAVILQWQGRSVRVRIEKVEVDDGSQSYEAFYDRQSAYVSNAEGIPAAPSSPPPSNVVGPTLIEPLDIHILQDADDGVGLLYYVAVSGILEAWQGAQIDLSYDGGANYVESATTRIGATMGELLTELPDHPQAYPDEVHTPTVRIDTPLGELESTTLAGLMSQDANLCIIGDELIQFAEADETAEGEWELSTLLRGRKGTSTAAHAIGERFVLLDRASLALVPANLSELGQTLTFRATSFGRTVDTATVVSMTFVGRSQIEREVAYLSAHRSGVNAVISWQGVGRLGAGISVAHGARFEGYRVTISDGVLEETIDTDAEELTHNVSGYGSPITIAVAQVNALTGAGPEIEVVLT